MLHSDHKHINRNKDEIIFYNHILNDVLAWKKKKPYEILKPDCSWFLVTQKKKLTDETR